MGTARVNGKAPVATKKALTQPVGRNQREIFAQHQDDFLADWQTLEKKVKSIDQMLKNSPLIGGAIRLAIEMSLRNVDWFFTSDNGEDDPLLDFVREARDNLVLSWDFHISDAALSPFYGWAAFTDEYELMNGRYLWKNFKFLLHDTLWNWNYDDRGQVESLEQLPHLWPDPIPVQRLLVYRFRPNGDNPEGESILRPLWVPYYYGSNLEEVRAIGYERHAMGLGMVTPPVGADMTVNGTDYDTAHNIIRNLRVDEQGGIILPAPTGEGDHMRWHVDLTSAANPQVFIALNNTIDSYQKTVMMGALAQFVIGGMMNVGTQAKASIDQSFFAMAVNAMADSIAEQFTKQAIMRLGMYNGLDMSAIKLEHSPAGDADTATLIEFIKATGGKVNWTPEDEVQIRSIMDMPEKTVEQIEEEERRRAEEQQRQFEQRRQMAQMQQGDNESEFSIYAASPVAGNAPDARERRRIERQWVDRWVEYGKQQQKRVMKGVKG